MRQAPARQWTQLPWQCWSGSMSRGAMVSRGSATARHDGSPARDSRSAKSYKTPVAPKSGSRRNGFRR